LIEVKLPMVSSK